MLNDEKNSEKWVWNYLFDSGYEYYHFNEQYSQFCLKYGRDIPAESALLSNEIYDK